MISAFTPFQLVSLWDMLNQVNLYKLNHVLACIRDHTMFLQVERANGIHGKRVPSHYLRTVDDLIKELQKYCQNLEMNRTLERFYRLNLDSYRDDWDGLIFQLKELQQAVERDLLEKTFFYVPQRESAYYDQNDLFTVQQQFPNANVEIRLAGNCYAIEAYSACVFHLMRAVEIGAKVMVRAMKAEQYLFNSKMHGKPVLRPVELCDWKVLFDGMEKALNVLEINVGSNVKKKEEYEFYHHAVYAFKNLRHAWRNKVMHSRHQYQRGETEDIIGFTRQFMMHLALRMKETKSDKL